MKYCSTVILVLWGFINLVPSSEGCQLLGVASTKTIPNNQMSASSSFKESHDYLTARFGRVNASTAWCPLTKYGFDWLQVDMGESYLVCGIATQGKASGAAEWTTSYWVSLSRDDVTWEQYKENGKVKFFQGNTDVSSIVRHNFITPFWRRYVRFYPTKFVIWPCLRVEIYVQFVAPVINQHPKPATVVAGEDLLLNCTAKGSPSPTITWKLNGNDVIFGKEMANGSLWVEKVENDKNFEGKYGCVATNRVGSDVSKEVDVVINEKPRILKSSQPQKSFLHGSTAVFSCYAIGEPAPTITWTKDGSTDISRATVHDDGHVLVITKVEAEIDQGVYQCRALNSFGEARSTFNVTVKGPSAKADSISINTLLTRKTIRCGLMQTVNIGCFGNSSLPLTYRWLKNKVPMTGYHGNSPIKVFDNILVVTPKKAKDYGTYVCHVSNGESSTEFEIELQQLVLETNKSGIVHAQKRSSPGPTSSSAPWGVIIPLLVVLVISIAINILLLRRFYHNKKSKKPSRLVVMSSMANDDSNYIPQSADIDWDNLAASQTAGSGYVGSTSYERL